MVPKDLLEYPVLAEAVEALKEAGFTQEELEKYDSYWDMVSTHKTLVVDSFNEGLRVGEERGEKRGERRGERKQGLKFARYLRDNNVSQDEVIKITGLPKKDVETIFNEIQSH